MSPRTTKIVSVAFLAAIISAQAAYATKTHIKFHNCKDSHHHFEANAAKTKDGAIGDYKRVSVGTTVEMHCEKSECYVYIYDGPHHKSYKNVTEGTEFYVHVKSSREFSVTYDGSNCGSEG